MTDVLNIDELKKILHDFADKRDWHAFHNAKNLSMALAAEAGELLEIFQWISEAELPKALQHSELKEKTSHELADILLYLIRLATEMDINLNQAIREKLAINELKYPAETVKGSAKKYDEY